ncbi:MAG: hypothetical protein ABJA84_04015 [Polaromonas sp.]
MPTPGSAILQKLRRVSSIEAGAAGFKFGFKLTDVGQEGGVSLAPAFTELIDQSKTDLVISGVNQVAQRCTARLESDEALRQESAGSRCQRTIKSIAINAHAYCVKTLFDAKYRLKISPTSLGASRNRP